MTAGGYSALEQAFTGRASDVGAAQRIRRTIVGSALEQRAPGPLLGLVGSAGSAGAGRRRRFELLNMRETDDAERWQEIHNTPEKYEVISEKYTTVGSRTGVEYTCLLTYFELGEDLPAVASARPRVDPPPDGDE